MLCIRFRISIVTDSLLFNFSANRSHWINSSSDFKLTPQNANPTIPA